MTTRPIGLLFALMICVSVIAGTQYSANYELELTIKEDQSSVRTRASFDSGGNIKHDFGSYRVHMLFEERSPQDFLMTVVVSETTSQSPIDDAILLQKFAGTYGGILEFEAKNELANVNGAIIVGSFK